MTKNKNYQKHGSKGGVKNQEKVSLGRTLFRSRFGNAEKEVGDMNKEKWLHTSTIDKTFDKVESFKSLTEHSSLDEFLNTAELANADFEAEKLNLNFATPKANAGLFSQAQANVIKATQTKFKDICLRIPRRPVWKNTEMDAAELQRKEREAFLDWRRNLALAQTNEHLSMTPFEKNLDFWRQLWRVIERSDVIVQIVDARNPILFHCEDLEVYVKEVDANKLNVLLINKSDFLSEQQRLAWLKYYEAKKVHVIFWSAALATDIDPDAMSETSLEDDEEREAAGLTDEDESDENSDDDSEEEDATGSSKIFNKFDLLGVEEEEDDSDSDSDSDSKNEPKAKSPQQQQPKKELEELEDSDDGSDTEVEAENEQENKIVEASPVIEECPELIEHLDYEISDEERTKCKILTRSELVTLFKTMHTSPDKAKAGITTIGLVGYPNVGKSSTINAILQDKKVAVSETPGKTKHYQTLYFDDELLLCDCPGLVFPSFVSTRGELILNGILPIDQMRDYVEPCNLITSHVPRNVFDMYYGMSIPKPKEWENPNRAPTSEELCSAYAIFRGYLNHKGMPDVSRSARFMLKDYVNGKLLYCYPPPGIDGASFQDHKYEQSKEVKYFEKNRRLKLQAAKKGVQQTTFDKEFFVSLNVRAMSKGGVVGAHRTSKMAKVKGCDLNASLDSQLDNKTWKKHFKKREGHGKLRRATSHFDKIDLF